MRRVLLALVVAGGLFLPPATAHASPSDPAQWPEFTGADPELTATPHTIRYSGADRYQTNLALGLALRGKGDFPFDTSDRTSGNASGLAQANDWWGAASCPRSIIVVAGDTFADALAAASLSDPTDRSEQPRLQRVAAEDPLFDPIGGYDRPDTASAPVVVTTSGRSGATALAPTARVTATDLAAGGCTTAKEAIIVGGTDAVPKDVESDLIGIGYREVFRVAGADRYETAANVAQAMGTSAPTSDTCVDPTADDGRTEMGWYGNAAFEYRADAHSCRVLPRAVVLADGGTGADALAAGWWTSYWQVPILLTAPDGSLPTATRVALQTMAVDTIIVLGGTARIPEDTVDKARFLAGAVAGRIAGADRTDTSIAMAKAFGGWFPTGNGADFANDIACFVASSGSGAGAQGWPDALAAGPVCGVLTASDRRSPVRALPPLVGSVAVTGETGGGLPAHDAVPVIVLPPVSDALPATVVDFLSSAFPPSASWCNRSDALSTCLGPGFGVVVGGEHGIGPSVVDDITSLVSGAVAQDTSDESPSMSGAFPTTLELGSVYSVFGDADGPAICVPEGDVANVRWLSLTSDPDRRGFLGESDLLLGGIYASPARVSTPFCVKELVDESEVSAAGVSLSGHVVGPVSWNLAPANHLMMTSAVAQMGTTSATHWSTSGVPEQPVTLIRGDQSADLRSAALDLDIVLGPGGTRATVTGTIVIETPVGSSTGAVVATAIRVGANWQVAGRATVQLAGGDTEGGFIGTVSDQGGETSAIDWQLDGF